MENNASAAIDASAYLHPQALVDDGARIGPRTRVWAFSHVFAGARIGADCNLCDHTLVEGAVRIGDRVTLKSGVYLWDGVIVEDDVFIGPAAAFTNDRTPRSRCRPEAYPETRLARGASIGAHATVLPGLRIGRWALVGAGSVVTRDVEDHALVYGNPARFAGWVCVCAKRLELSGPGDVQCDCGRRYRYDGAKLMEEETA